MRKFILRLLIGKQPDLGEKLYNEFWRKNEWPKPTPFKQQSQPIIDMWNKIAKDAIENV